MTQSQRSKELFELAKQQLMRSNADKKHAFRTFVLGTMGTDPLRAELRTVVNRNVDENLSILFYTDSRSPKVSQIRKNGKVTALFWHPRKQLQLRIKGTARVLPDTDERYTNGLQSVTSSPARSDYMAATAPGTALNKKAQEAELAATSINFSAILINADHLDILQLSREGHRRAVANQEGQHWQVHSVTP